MRNRRGRMAMAIVWLVAIGHTVVTSWFSGWGALLALLLELGIVAGLNLSPTFLNYGKRAIMWLKASRWDGALGMTWLSALGSRVMQSQWQLSRPADDGDFLSRIPVFRSLPAITLGRLYACMSEEIFAPGQEIVTQGEKGEAMFIIEEGQADVEVDGRQVASLGPSKYFGELSLEAAASDSVRTATVRAGAHGVHCFKLVRRLKGLCCLRFSAAYSMGKPVLSEPHRCLSCHVVVGSLKIQNTIGTKSNGKRFLRRGIEGLRLWSPAEQRLTS